MRVLKAFALVSMTLKMITLLFLKILAWRQTLPYSSVHFLIALICVNKLN